MTYSGYDYSQAQDNLTRKINELSRSGLDRYDASSALRSYRGFWRANGSSVFVLLCMYATATGTAIAAFYSGQQRKNEEAIIQEQQRQLADELDRLRAQVAHQRAALASLQHELGSSSSSSSSSTSGGGFWWSSVQRGLLQITRDGLRQANASGMSHQNQQEPEAAGKAIDPSTGAADVKSGQQTAQQPKHGVPLLAAARPPKEVLVVPQPQSGFTI